MLGRRVPLALVCRHRRLIVAATHIVLDSPTLGSAPVRRTLDVLFGSVRIISILGSNTALVAKFVAIIVDGTHAI